MMKIKGYTIRTPYLTVLALLLLSLQSCGSSGSDSSANSANTPFMPPIDAASLRNALLTGSSTADTSQSWECVLSDNATQLSYRLIADGTGVEIDKNNLNNQSDFTWRATSANTVTTTVSSSGMQVTFTDIRFTDQNNMSLLVAESSTMLNCVRVNFEPTMPATTTGNNSLSYGGVVYGLTHGFEEQFSFRPVQRGDTHSASNFDVADAKFELVTILANGLTPTLTIWRPNDANVWLRATLRHPGEERFTSAIFSYEPNSVDENGPSVAGRSFFNEGSFGIDINQNGSIESEDGEFIDITAGTISVERLLGNNARMSFDVTLANGENVNGEFQGLFVLFEN